jgi:hypothetical protein
MATSKKAYPKKNEGAPVAMESIDTDLAKGALQCIELSEAGVNAYEQPLCPFCARDIVIGTEANMDSLVDHVVREHTERVSAFMFNPKLGLSAFDVLMAEKKQIDDDASMDVEGFRVVEDLNHHDYLALPESAKEKLRSEGGRFRWCIERRVSHHKNRDAEIWQRGKEERLAYQRSTEDSTARSNEFLLVYFPQKVMERNDRIKKGLVEAQNDGLPVTHEGGNSGEYSDKGELAYNHFRHNMGMSRVDAMKHAERAEKGLYESFNRAAEKRRELMGQERTHRR